MQTEGTLSKWNESKGYGFITPRRGGADIFVHISAFPEDGQRPQLQEKLSFTVATDANGKRQAVQVQRPRQKQDATKRPTKARPRINVAALLASTALLAAIFFYGYTGLYTQQPDAIPAAPKATALPSSTFQCDGRTQCSQMRSCEEATFFLRNCPNVQMDGDENGVPCEQQWCSRSSKPDR